MQFDYHFGISTIFMLLVVFLLNNYVIIKYKISKNSKIFLILFDLIHVIFYFIVFPLFFEPYQDTGYYYDRMSSDLSLLEVVKYELSHVLSISLPPISVNIFNHLASFFLDTNNIFIVGYIHVVLFHISLYFLSKALCVRKLPQHLVLLLFLSPSIFTFSMPLLKDLFVLTVLIFTVVSFLSKRYIVFVFILLILFMARTYAVMAVFPTVLAFLYLNNYVKNKNNTVLIKLAIAHLIFSLILLHIVRDISLLDPAQSIKIYLATMFSPVASIDNIFSTQLMGVNLVESGLTFIFSVYVMILVIVILILKNSIYIGPIRLFVMFILLSFSYFSFLSSESYSIFNSLNDTHFLSVGAHVVRKKLPILPIYYIFGSLIVFEIYRVSRLTFVSRFRLGNHD
jgi:hypothetical protein